MNFDKFMHLCKQDHSQDVDIYITEIFPHVPS